MRVTDRDFDNKELIEPAKALLQGNWSKAATGLVSAAAIRASDGNPFVGIVTGQAAQWLWAKVAACSATEKLLAERTKLESLDEKARIAFVQHCLQDGFATAKVGDISPVPGDLAELSGMLEEGLSAVLRGIAVLKQGQQCIRDEMAHGFADMTAKIDAATSPKPRAPLVFKERPASSRSGATDLFNVLVQGLKQLESLDENLTVCTHIEVENPVSRQTVNVDILLRHSSPTATFQSAVVVFEQGASPDYQQVVALDQIHRCVGITKTILLSQQEFCEQLNQDAHRFPSLEFQRLLPSADPVAFLGSLTLIFCDLLVLRCTLSLLRPWTSKPLGEPRPCEHRIESLPPNTELVSYLGSTLSLDSLVRRRLSAVSLGSWLHRNRVQNAKFLTLATWPPEPGRADESTRIALGVHDQWGPNTFTMRHTDGRPFSVHGISVVAKIRFSKPTHLATEAVVSKQVNLLNHTLRLDWTSLSTDNGTTVKHSRFSICGQPTLTSDSYSLTPPPTSKAGKL